MSDTGDLFDCESAKGHPEFDGVTYDPSLDHRRLTIQLGRVYRALLGPAGYCLWKTLGEISATTGDPEASISARLRDLRKNKFGAHIIEGRRRGDPNSGHWEYRLVPNTDTGMFAEVG